MLLIATPPWPTCNQIKLKVKGHIGAAGKLQSVHCWYHRPESSEDLLFSTSVLSEPRGEQRRTEEIRGEQRRTEENRFWCLNRSEPEAEAALCVSVLTLKQTCSGNLTDPEHRFCHNTLMSDSFTTSFNRKLLQGNTKVIQIKNVWPWPLGGSGDIRLPLNNKLKTDVKVYKV